MHDDGLLVEDEEAATPAFVAADDGLLVKSDVNRADGATPAFVATEKDRPRSAVVTRPRRPQLPPRDPASRASPFQWRAVPVPADYSPVLPDGVTRRERPKTAPPPNSKAAKERGKVATMVWREDIEKRAARLVAWRLARAELVRKRLDYSKKLDATIKRKHLRRKIIEDERKDCLPFVISEGHVDEDTASIGRQSTVSNSSLSVVTRRNRRRHKRRTSSHAQAPAAAAEVVFEAKPTHRDLSLLLPRGSVTVRVAVAETCDELKARLSLATLGCSSEEELCSFFSLGKQTPLLASEFALVPEASRRPLADDFEMGQLPGSVVKMVLSELGGDLRTAIRAVTANDDDFEDDDIPSLPSQLVRRRKRKTKKKSMLQSARGGSSTRGSTRGSMRSSTPVTSGTQLTTPPTATTETLSSTKRPYIHQDQPSQAVSPTSPKSPMAQGSFDTHAHVVVSVASPNVATAAEIASYRTQTTLAKGARVLYRVRRPDELRSELPTKPSRRQRGDANHAALRAFSYGEFASFRDIGALYQEPSHVAILKPTEPSARNPKKHRPLSARRRESIVALSMQDATSPVVPHHVLCNHLNLLSEWPGSY